MSLRITGGRFKNHRIYAPKGTTTRPTLEKARQSLFNSWQMHMEGAVFLDLFAGSGAIGLEAISRGAAHATFVDRSPEAIRCIQKNISNLQLLSKATVLKKEALQALHFFKKNHKTFDLIYLDPPYRENPLKSAACKEACIQYIDKEKLLNCGGMLALEDSDKHGQTPCLASIRFDKTRQIGDSFLHYYHAQN